jgi:hypothetical protein
MKKWILFFSLFWGWQEDQPERFDETLPKVDFTKFSIVESGGGFGIPTTYALSFSATIINQTDNVFKTYRQNVSFTAVNGNQVNGQITLPMFRWLCPFDTLNGGGKSVSFEEGFIDSVITWEMIKTGTIITYGVGNECDD